MRLKKEMIKLISSKMVNSLLKEEFIIFTENPSKLEEIINSIITEDLMVEDKLNQEVKKIIDSHANEAEYRNLDHGRMFQMVKRTLVRERNLIL